MRVVAYTIAFTPDSATAAIALNASIIAKAFASAASINAYTVICSPALYCLYPGFYC
jgi:hypothetical protein